MRIIQFQQNLQTDGALIDQPTDLLYLTGLHLSRGVLALTKHKAALFVDGRYTAYAQKNGPCPVLTLDGAAPLQFLRDEGASSIAFDSATTSYDTYQSLLKHATQLDLIPQTMPLKGMRMRKSVEEIAALKKAQRLTHRGYEYVLSQLKVGITEEELAFAFEFFVRKEGASGLSFESIIAFGENSAYPHHRAGKTALQKNQLVLVDVGAVVADYHGDMTRVHFFGKVDAQLEKMLHWTQRAQLAAIAKVRPGARLGDLDLAAREVFQQMNIEDRFTHGLGHGIGLETHEPPVVRKNGSDSNLILETGMVFTIEPGLYIPGVGGTRWEDIICVTADGAELC